MPFPLRWGARHIIEPSQMPVGGRNASNGIDISIGVEKTISDPFASCILDWRVADEEAGVLNYKVR